MKKIIFALAALVCLASCEIERDPSIVIQEMMNSQNGLLVNDLGVKYSITGQENAAEILALTRVFLTGTATPSETAGYDYDLKPYEWYGVDIKDCVTLSTVEDVDETLGTAPVCLNHVWVEGGYINALVTVSYDADQDYDGEVNLVFDDSRSSDSSLYFILKHKQEGRNWEDPELTSDKAYFGTQFFSFRYSQCYDPSFKGEQSYNLEWRWFDSTGYDGELPYRTVSDKQGNFTITVQ